MRVIITVAFIAINVGEVCGLLKLQRLDQRRCQNHEARVGIGWRLLECADISLAAGRHYSYDFALIGKADPRSGCVLAHVLLPVPTSPSKPLASITSAQSDMP